VDEVIYALVDQRDNLEFYVGRTQDLYKRFLQHIRCDGTNDAKNARVLELKAMHLAPVMKTLEIVRDDPALAGEREAYWIRHFKYLGIDLTNGLVYTQGAQQTKVTGKKRAHSGKRSVTVKDAASILGLSETYIRDLRVKGTLRRSEANKNLILMSSILEFQKNRKPPNGDPLATRI